jgi:hypothetical protein
VCQACQHLGHDPCAGASANQYAPQWSRDLQQCVDDAGWFARTQTGTKPSQANNVVKIKVTYSSVK